MRRLCSRLPCVAAAGTLITPIAPHSLSFRPLVVPESSEIVVQIPRHARSHARYTTRSEPPNVVYPAATSLAARELRCRSAEALNVRS